MNFLSRCLSMIEKKRGVQINSLTLGFFIKFRAQIIFLEAEVVIKFSLLK